MSRCRHWSLRRGCDSKALSIRHMRLRTVYTNRGLGGCAPGTHPELRFRTTQRPCMIATQQMGVRRYAPISRTHFTQQAVRSRQSVFIRGRAHLRVFGFYKPKPWTRANSTEGPRTVELRTHKPLVAGSNPAAATTELASISQIHTFLRHALRVPRPRPDRRQERHPKDTERRHPAARPRRAGVTPWTPLSDCHICLVRAGRCSSPRRTKY
jgi:hypothetical protein